MKLKSIWLAVFGMMAWVMLYAAAPAQAADDLAMQSGKSVTVTFSSKTRVGNLTLSRGAYRIQHRVDGAEHFIHFTEIVGSPYQNPGYATGRPRMVRGDRGNAECKAELLPDKVKRTAITRIEENGVRRITRIEIAGENVAHLF